MSDHIPMSDAVEEMVQALDAREPSADEPAEEPMDIEGPWRRGKPARAPADQAHPFRQSRGDLAAVTLASFRPYAPPGFRCPSVPRRVPPPRTRERLALSPFPRPRPTLEHGRTSFLPPQATSNTADNLCESGITTPRLPPFSGR